MSWHTTDHNKMKAVKDPRVDGQTGNSIEIDTTEMKQSDMRFKNSEESGC
jgi:hypothetical protein